MAYLEHVNITVSDPEHTAKTLSEIFGWTIRWTGPAIHEGQTCHVGGDTHYLAVYAKDTPKKNNRKNYETVNGLNHIGIVVEDMESVEARVKSAGFKTYNHSDYAPGRRFYFRDQDEIEYEVVSYMGT